MGATINSSKLWNSCKVLTLTKNMRLQNISSPTESAEVKEFADWIIKLGDGKLGGPNDGISTIEIPDDLVVHTTGDTVKAIVDATYPDLKNNITDPSFLQSRAILAPTLEIVEQVNNYIVSLNDSEQLTYLSADSMCRFVFLLHYILFNQTCIYSFYN